MIEFTEDLHEFMLYSADLRSSRFKFFRACSFCWIGVELFFRFFKEGKVLIARSFPLLVQLS